MPSFYEARKDNIFLHLTPIRAIIRWWEGFACLLYTNTQSRATAQCVHHDQDITQSLSDLTQWKVSLTMERGLELEDL